MMIISVAQRKGGSGKTTLSLSIGCELQARGYATLIIDADPVRSKYYFDKLTYDINYLASKFLKKAICSIFTSLSCFILVT